MLASRPSVVFVLAVLAAGFLPASGRAAPVRTLACHRISSTSCKVSLALHPAENGLTIQVPLPKPDKGYSPTLNKTVAGFAVDPRVSANLRVYSFLLSVPKRVPKGAVLTVTFDY